MWHCLFSVDHLLFTILILFCNLLMINSFAVTNICNQIFFIIKQWQKILKIWFAMRNIQNNVILVNFRIFLVVKWRLVYGVDLDLSIFAPIHEGVPYIFFCLFYDSLLCHRHIFNIHRGIIVSKGPVVVN